MKAAQYLGKEQLIVREVPDPVLEDGEVMLSIDACCVCGTDLRTYRNGDKRIEEGRILGHEFCGTVLESRSKDASVSVGDRVAMYIVILHGADRYVDRGRANLSALRTTMSYHHDGAFAPLMKVPAVAVRQNNLFKVPEGMSAERMSLAEPLGCVMNAHSRLGVTAWDVVVIIGAGPIGLLHAIVCRLQGAQKIIMIDVNAARLAQAGEFDIDHAVQSKPDGSHRDEIARLTAGIGPDVVIVAVSAGPAAADALAIAGKAARVCFFAGLPKSNPTASLDLNQIHYKELMVTGSFSEKKSDFEAALALLKNSRFPHESKLITHHLPLARIAEAFPLMESGASLKVCIHPGEDSR